MGQLLAGALKHSTNDPNWVPKNKIQRMIFDMRAKAQAAANPMAAEAPRADVLSMEDDAKRVGRMALTGIRI